MATEPTTETDETHVTADETDEKAVFVVDPEDYQKTRRLKEIHQAKKAVQKTRRNRSQIIEDRHDKFTSDGVETYQRELAQAVAQYGNELMPLIRQARETGTLTEEDLTCSLGPDRADMDVIEFITFDGQVSFDGDMIDCPEVNSLAVYRALNDIMADLGLGLDLETKQTREWEI